MEKMIKYNDAVTSWGHSGAHWIAVFALVSQAMNVLGYRFRDPTVAIHT